MGLILGSYLRSKTQRCHIVLLKYFRLGEVVENYLEECFIKFIEKQDE